MITRLLYTTGRSTQADVVDLLQGILVSELLSPGPEFWLTSPWISDIPVLDNRSDEFTSLVPEWTPRRIRLSEVLGRMAARGTRILIATRPDEHGQKFVQVARQTGDIYSCRDDIHVCLNEDLHEKGVLTTTSYLSGSMNLTHRGIHVNDEHLRFDTDPAILGEARLAFRHRWDQQPVHARVLP